MGVSDSALHDCPYVVGRDPEGENLVDGNGGIGVETGRFERE
jgi:hypothetical protein